MPERITKKLESIILFFNTNFPVFRSGILWIVFALLSTGLMMVDSIENELNKKNSLQPMDSEITAPFDDSFLNRKSEAITVADGDTVVVKSTGTDLSYDVTEIRAEAGSTLTIRYENTSNMPHNIVFVNSRPDIQPVGVAALQAKETDYIPQDEAVQEKIFGYTSLAKPGDTVHVTLTVPPAGTYPFICTYPGHFTMMQGDLISV